MKPHRILQTFTGSQTGLDQDVFEAGTVRELSAHLAEAVVPAGLAEPVEETKPEAAKPEAPQAQEPEQIETKVVEPEETKPLKPLAKKGKK